MASPASFAIAWFICPKPARASISTVALFFKTTGERLQSRLQELLGASIDKERILQEAALLVDRSDIQEEIVRLETHVQHFLGLLDQGGEIGKKMDFLLQEMNREADAEGCCRKRRVSPAKPLKLLRQDWP